MPVNYVINSLWTWIATKGLTLCILVCIAFLIPRIGRLIVRWVTIDMDRREHAKATQTGKDLVVDSESRKGRLALLGAVVYIVEAIAFFFVAIHILKQFGFSTSGAAIPATAVSAALAFGAQKIIADFLAGFFIITERQFGVGDWVVFNTAAGPIEGEVTAVTLRATTVRTISGEEATVANSVPSSCINTSSGWSRAIIDMPIPISAADNTEQLTALFDSCVAQTLSSPSLARLVSTDDDAIKILPATKLISPTSAGVPWCLNYRVIIQVEPGEQWVVERAVRAAVMNEMWAAYTDSTMDSFVEIPGVTTDLTGHHNPAATAHTLQIPTPSRQEAQEDPSTDTDTDTGSDTPTQVIPQVTHTVSAPTQEIPAMDTPAEKEKTGEEKTQDDDSKKTALEKEAEDALTRGLWRRDHHSSALARILSVGGRCRPSTMALLLALFVLLILRGLSLDGGEQGVGILAPTSSQSSTQTNTGTSSTQSGQELSTQVPQTPTTEQAQPSAAPSQDSGSTSGSQSQSGSSQQNSNSNNSPSYSWNSGSSSQDSSSQDGSSSGTQSGSSDSGASPTTGVASPTTAPQSSANRSGTPATNAAGSLE